MTRAYDAILFDLLTALLDSWTLWNKVAGSDEAGLRWRAEYLKNTYATGRYRPYEDLVGEAARNVGLPCRSNGLRSLAHAMRSSIPGPRFLMFCKRCTAPASRSAS
ncbi:hypothetical protein ACVWY2_006813 [Bradyrhizobium sp. JR6.1]